MKKRILFLSSVLLPAIVTLTACGGDGSPEAAGEDTEPRQTVTVSQIEIESVPEETVSSSPVDTEKETVEQGNIVVEYPQVRDLDGGKIQKQVNRLMEQDAKACVEKDLEKDAGTGVVESSVIYHGSTMSVVSTGTITSEKGEQTTVVYTTNVDLTTGERVSTGVRENAASIAKQIVDGELTIMEPDAERKGEIADYLQGLGEKKLTKILQKCDFTEKSTKPKCFSYYIAEDSDEIGIYLPVTAKLGNYAILLQTDR